MPLSLCEKTGLQVVPLWIDGEMTNSLQETTFSVHSFKEQKDVYIAQSADTGLAIRAGDVSLRAFANWRRTSPDFRRDLLLRAAAIFERRISEAVSYQMEETSCEQAWASFNVTYGLTVMREVASKTTAVFGELLNTASDANIAMTLKEPIGPSLLIAPWNAAFVLAARGIFTMLAAGCTVVFKASEQCPRTHHFIAEVFAEAGLPNGVLNVLQCRREDAAAVTECLVGHRAIRKIEFIGSPAVGSIIGQLGGKYLKPVLMELGGKCAAIVLDDANLDDAAEKCIRGAFMHHGQICFSTERIIILKDVAVEFIELLKQKAVAFEPGSGVSETVVRTAYERLVEAEEKGAKFLCGGPKYATHSELVPTILTDVTEDMSIFDTESFGPSVSVYVARDEEHAIELANNSVYGLNASVHTTNMYRATTVARQLQFGQIHVNSLTAHNEATFPIGGTKSSGWGRNNSHFGIEEFIQVKTVSYNMNQTAINFGRK